jgi:hypothetical protein
MGKLVKRLLGIKMSRMLLFIYHIALFIPHAWHFLIVVIFCIYG